MSGNLNGVGPVGRIVARRVRQLREARGMTKQALTDALMREGRNILPIGIARIEAGTRRIDVDDLLALAKALGVDLPRLLEADACPACHGAPPAGFACLACGTEAGR